MKRNVILCEKVCYKCKKTKTIKKFEKDENNKYLNRCLDCKKKMQSKYHKKKNIKKKSLGCSDFNPIKLGKILFWAAKTRAKKRNVKFQLKISDIKIPKFCPILKIPLFRGKGVICPNSPSIDRIIPELGYVKGNIQIISHRANTIKNNASLEDLEKIVLYLEKI